MRNSESQESLAAMEDWIEPPVPPGSWSARASAAAGLACAGLGVLQGALRLAWLPPLPLAEAIDAGLGSTGLTPGNLLLSGLLLGAVSRCLSALGRHHLASAPDGRFEEELRSTLESQADQIQHLHVSALGIERSLLEQQARSQVLTEGRLEAQRGSLEHLRAVVDSLREELRKPRAESPREAERWQRFEQQLEQRLTDLEVRLESGLAALEQNLSGELVQASETLAHWLSSERSALSDSLESDLEVLSSQVPIEPVQAAAAAPAYDPRNARIELEELPHVESIEIDPQLLETSRAALPTSVAELEEPLYDALDLDAGQQEFSPLDREEFESWRSAPASGGGRNGFASAPLLEPKDAAALAQTGFHRVQSLGFLDGIEEPSHPQLADAGPQQPPHAALDQAKAPLPGRACSPAKGRTP